MFPRRFRLAGAAGITGLGLVVASSSLAPLVQGQPGTTGKELFERRCTGCHALDRDKEGPRLGSVFGRMAGSVDSFSYSSALKSSKIIWRDESLEKWLTDPEQLVPGNDMAFRLEKADERRAIIAYLKQNPGK